jgi:ferrochelatase
MRKKGVLLVNLGTPDKPTTGAVRKYLREFLMDGRVIDIPFFGRWLLVNLIIAPFRAPKVVKEYKKLWTENGSPLMFYGYRVKELLQEKLGGDFYVELAMRYQNPSIARALESMKAQKITDLTLIPLFPQYASATSGSVIDKVMSELRTWHVIPDLRVVSHYHTQPKMIRAFADNARKYLEKEKYDHIVFSYHGLPERHLKKMGADYNQCEFPGCSETCARGVDENRYCYRSACFETSGLIARELGIPENDYSVCFQSRLGKDPWIQPYTEDVVDQLNEKGLKRVLAFSPAFVSDCLETTLEVGEQYKEQFLEGGGEKWQLVESLNELPGWIECLEDLVKDH